MKEKLTLSIEKTTKEQAKRYARQKGTSVSQMVEEFLESVTYQEDEDWRPPEGSLVAEMSGSIPDTDKRDYDEILTEALMEKYGLKKDSD